MFKTKTAAKWLESVKKNALIDILEKPYKTLRVPSVSLPSEALKEQKIRSLEMERIKAQALEHVRRIQLR